MWTLCVEVSARFALPPHVNQWVSPEQGKFLRRISDWSSSFLAKLSLLTKGASGILILLSSTFTLFFPSVKRRAETKIFSRPNTVSELEGFAVWNVLFLGNQFSPEFEAHIRRVIRLLWHCLGHLYLKHWDHLGRKLLKDLILKFSGSLELRPQCALVLAHLSCLSKLFNLLDAKDQALVEETLTIVRPPLFTVQAPSEEKEEVPQQPRYSRVPSSKSGSWGGHPTPAVLSCKPYAQTC